MANTDVATGLSPVREKGNAPYSGGCNRYYVPATDGTALYVGDPVIIAGSGDADGVPSVTRATAGAGNAITGVVVGFDPILPFGPGFREASTERYVLVADDPDLTFEVQESGSIPVTSIGLNADLLAGTGSDVTKYSGFELNSASAAVGATLQLRIEGFVQRVDNEVDTNAKLLVTINNHKRAYNTAGV